MYERISLDHVRILWVTTSASFDGPGRMLAALLNHWPDGDQVVVVTLESATPEFRRDVPAAVEIHELGAHGRWDASAAARLATLARAIGPDLIHTQLSRADWVGRPVARLLGVPVVSTIQNVHSRMYDAEFWWPIAKAGEAFDRLTIPMVERFIAVSAGVRDDLERAGVAAERITVIHNAIDLDRCRHLGSRTAVRDSWGCSSEDIVIGTVGLLKPQKGIPVLIEAARSVVDRDARARFVHIGGGPLQQDTLQGVEAAGLAGRFQLLDRVEEPMTVLGGLDVFVLPSLWEGLPIALLEAMAAGLPCVGTHVAGIEEAIEPGVSGLIVPPGDAPALADAVLELMSDAARRRAMGDAAGARVRNRFDAVAMAEAYRRLYLEIISANGPTTPHTAHE